jgi:hypothetical protein
MNFTGQEFNGVNKADREKQNLKGSSLLLTLAKRTNPD